MVEVTGLTKGFSRLIAVDKVSFVAPAGEVFGLLGENGAGKTTTLRMLATLLIPDGGTATINGYDLVREPEQVRRQLGVLFNPGLYGRLTARENIAYFGKLYGVPASELSERVDGLLTRFGIEEYAHRRAGSLSRGMRQRVALARVLVHDPPVLILDEPTTALDVAGTRLVHEFISEARERGKTIILSSHNMAEVEKLCQRVAIIHRGRIALEGTLHQVKAQRDSLEDILLGLGGDRG